MKKLPVSSKGVEILNKAGKAGNIFNGVVATKEILEIVRDTIKIQEEEKTKRRAIKAQERTALAQIEANKELLHNHFERTFEERKRNFDRLFDLLDKSLDKGDAQTTGAILQSITEVATSSPLDDLAKIPKKGESFEI